MSGGKETTEAAGSKANEEPYWDTALAVYGDYQENTYSQQPQKDVKWMGTEQGQGGYETLRPILVEWFYCIPFQSAQLVINKKQNRF